MIRVPAPLVGLALALVLGALTFLLARLAGRADLPTILLPACSAAGGFVAGRWANRPAVVPGFSVGLLAVAVRLGLGLGLGLGMTAFVSPSLALLEIVAAITGGMAGMLAARRAEPHQRTKPEYTPLS